VPPSLEIVNRNTQFNLPLPAVCGTALDAITELHSCCDQQCVVSDRFPAREEVGFEAGGRKLNIPSYPATY
jgi:hypothetical protein